MVAILKKVIVAAGFFLLALSVNAQSVNCKLFREGKFKSTFGGHTLFIERKGNKQTEQTTNLKDTISMSFDVKWLNDCTYTLDPDKQTLAKYPKIPPHSIVTVTITKTTAGAYSTSSTSNFSDKVVLSEVVRVD